MEDVAELYQRHAEAVLRFHYRRTGCPQTAADLTAETFAAAYASRKRFRDVGAPAQAWLFTIARRQLSHFVRHEKVRDKYRHKLGVGSVDLSYEDFERIDELVDLETTRDELRRVMAELPEQQARAVQLRIADEQPYAEVAARLGCSEGVARVWVSRALVRLADLMEAP